MHFCSRIGPNVLVLTNYYNEDMTIEQGISVERSLCEYILEPLLYFAKEYACDRCCIFTSYDANIRNIANLACSFII
jgi:hypothetical protein